MSQLQKVDILSKEQLLSYLKRFDTIMSFCPLPDEPDINFLNQWILSQDKTLICPKIDGEGLLPCKISNLNQLKPSKWWILEPVECEQVKLSKIEIVLVPVQKFDIYGHREGRGKGYYDKFLAKLPDALKVGVFRSSQLVDRLNPNPWDIGMDMLVQFV